MMNSTQISYFTFNAYFDTGHLKYLYFSFVMLLYVFMISSNFFLIMVICMNRSLHEPMYLFLCSLFINELYGSTGMIPFLLIQILSDIHTVSIFFCFLQIFSVYTYANVQFCNLAFMSYDRYLAICYPLHYTTLMTSKKVSTLIGVTWLFPFIEVAVMISLSAPLKLCGNIINKVYCDNYSVVKLACTDTTINNVYGITYTLIVVIGVFTLIFYSYMRILRICFSGCKQSRQKAISTCTPHLASLLNFCFGCFFEIIQSRFNMSRLPNKLRIFLSLYFIICQPILNPVLYGLNISKIRRICRSLILGKI